MIKIKKKTLTFNYFPAERVSLISGGERNPEIVELLSAREKKRTEYSLCYSVTWNRYPKPHSWCKLALGESSGNLRAVRGTKCTLSTSVCQDKSVKLEREEEERSAGRDRELNVRGTEICTSRERKKGGWDMQTRRKPEAQSKLGDVWCSTWFSGTVFSLFLILTMDQMNYI